MPGCFEPVLGQAQSVYQLVLVPISCTQLLQHHELLPQQPFRSNHKQASVLSPHTAAHRHAPQGHRHPYAFTSEKDLMVVASLSFILPQRFSLAPVVSV